MKSASFSIDPQSAIGSFSFKGWTNHIQDHQIFFCSIYVKKYEDLQFPGKFKGGYNRWVTTWMSVGDTGRIETEPIVVGVSDWETDNRKKERLILPQLRKLQCVEIWLCESHFSPFTWSKNVWLLFTVVVIEDRTPVSIILSTQSAFCASKGRSWDRNSILSEESNTCSFTLERSCGWVNRVTLLARSGERTLLAVEGFPFWSRWKIYLVHSAVLNFSF